MSTQQLSEAPTIPASTPIPVTATPTSASGAFRHYLLDRRPDGSMWELGRGGMGVTYKATDANLHCTVALKIIGPQCFGGDNNRERFIREARLAAQIRHPNVAAVHHLEAESEDIFYAMEFVDGITAEQWVKARGAMSLELALDVAMQVSRALTAADRLRLVHRDIKPANIMLLPDPADGARVIVKVIDFGLARSLGAEAVPAVTTCSFVGTPQYASPEQIENLPLDIRSDIYSLGCVLWYLLTTEAPFSGSTARVMAQQLTSDAPFERLAHVPAAVIALLRGMLAKNPSARPQTPVALHAQICECRAALPRHETGRRSAPANLAARFLAFRPKQRAIWYVLSPLVLFPLAWLAFAQTKDPTPANQPAVEPAPAAVIALPPTIRTAPDEQQQEPMASLPDVSPPPALTSLAAWDPPMLEIGNFQEEPAPFWMMAASSDPSGTVDLTRAGNVDLSLGPEQIVEPAVKKAVTKAFPKNRKSSGDTRRSSSGNPLQRAGRTVRGLINKIL